MANLSLLKLENNKYHRDTKILSMQKIIHKKNKQPKSRLRIPSYDTKTHTNLQFAEIIPQTTNYPNQDVEFKLMTQKLTKTYSSWREQHKSKKSILQTFFKSKKSILQTGTIKG